MEHAETTVQLDMEMKSNVDQGLAVSNVSASLGSRRAGDHVTTNIESHRMHA